MHKGVPEARQGAKNVEVRGWITSDNMCCSIRDEFYEPETWNQLDSSHSLFVFLVRAITTEMKGAERTHQTSLESEPVQHLSWYDIMPKERAIGCTFMHNTSETEPQQFMCPVIRPRLLARFWPTPPFCGCLSQAESSTSQASRLSHVSNPCWGPAPTGRSYIDTNSGQSVPCEN